MEYIIKQGLAANPGAREIRQAVFVEEQGFSNEFDEIDATAWHVVAVENGVPTACARTFPKEGEPGVYTVGRMAVKKPWRGTGLGLEVMRRVEQTAAGLGAVRLELSAQIQARGFYERLGYTAYGPEYNDEHCPHISMYKRLSE